jgi:hypothetical protein
MTWNHSTIQTRFGSDHTLGKRGWEGGVGHREELKEGREGGREGEGQGGRRKRGRGRMEAGGRKGGR